MKYLIGTYMILGIFLFTNLPLSAQEIETEISIEGESEVNLDESSMVDTETDEDPDSSIEENELSENEINEILDDTDILTEEDIDNLDDLEGKVIAVTENEVIIESENGEIIVVTSQAYEDQIRRGGGSGRKAKVGDKVETGVVNNNGSNTTITTKSGTYNVPSNVYLTKNGSQSSLDEIEDGDEVVIILDSEGNLVALEIINEIEEASNLLLIGSILAILLLIILALISRMKKQKQIIN